MGQDVSTCQGRGFWRAQRHDPAVRRACLPRRMRWFWPAAALCNHPRPPVCTIPLCLSLAGSAGILACDGTVPAAPCTYYTKHRSLYLDLLILLKAAGTVLSLGGT